MGSAVNSAPNMEGRAEDFQNIHGELPEETPQVQKLDAGAIFVLESKGSWLHCGYHLTTSIVGPPLLSLPLTLAIMGWAAGVIYLLVAAGVTFYSYFLLSLVLEHHAQLGNRLLRFRDMAHHVLGPNWSRYCIGPLQFLLCLSVAVAGVLLGGITLKAIYLVEKPEGTMKLYEFIILCGLFMLVLVQIPSVHSLRHLNLISLLLCLAYSACVTAGSIYIGHSSHAPQRVLHTRPESRPSFDVFTAISIIATTYGCGIIPEIQASIAPPIKGKMLKGLCVCYTVALSTFVGVAISGYWAFGNLSQSNILSNFISPDNIILVPKWFYLMINFFIIIQFFAISVLYLQPTNEVLEKLLADPRRHQYSTRNVVPRIISRSLVVIVSTLVAAMIPFFGDIIAVIGAFVILPLDFVLPSVMYGITFRPPARSTIFWVNITIIIVFSGLTVLGCIAALRQVILDAKSYKLFANL